MSFDQQNQSLLLKVEATPGTPETLAASDGNWYQENIKFSPDVEKFAREPYKATRGTDPGLQGPKKASITVESELIGPGAGLFTVPPLDAAFRVCGMAVTPVVRIPIGAITGGPFRVDEVVTQGAVSGIVAKKTRTGSPFLFVYGVTGGSFAGSGTITGVSSGATVSPTGAPAAPGGQMYRRISSAYQYATIGHNAASNAGGTGLRHTLNYCLGNFALRFAAGNRCIVAFNFMGRWSSTSDVTFVAGTRPGFTPPQLGALNAVLLQDGYAGTINEISFDLGNTLGIIPNANDPTFLGETVFNGIGRATAQANPLLELVTVHDIYGKFRLNTLGDIDVRIGSTDGNQFFVHAPNVTYGQPDEGEIEGRKTAELALELHESAPPGNNDLIIISS